jgi:hypothetical protein
MLAIRFPPGFTADAAIFPGYDNGTYRSCALKVLGPGLTMRINL